jgi:hypothetical protein
MIYGLKKLFLYLSTLFVPVGLLFYAWNIIKSP